ncbi:unnamed protein product [Closterium sp. NIES-53]
MTQPISTQQQQASQEESDVPQLLAALPVSPPPLVEGSSSALVRLLFADLSGQRRVRVVPWDRFRTLTCQQGIGLARCIYAFASFVDGPAPGCGLSAVGEVRLMPDVSTLRTLPWCPSQMLALVDAHVAPGQPFAVCPRSTLRRVAASLKDRFGLVLRAGFESEFTLLHSTTPSMVPVDRTLYCSSLAFDEQAELMGAMVGALHGMGIPVEQLHPESGGGQFEIAVGHAADVAAADRILLVREAISGVVRRAAAAGAGSGEVEGTSSKRSSTPTHVTFLPQVFPRDAANGSHVHVSIWREVTSGADASSASPSASAATTSAGAPIVVQEGGRTYINAFAARAGRRQAREGQETEQHWEQQEQQHGMSEEGQQFMAGVMAHLPSIMALSCPLPNSYERLGPNKWTGAFQCWGHENREAAVRVAAPPTDTANSAAAAGVADATAAAAAAAGVPAAFQVTNFEVKACDACAQPHLVLAAITAAGMDGLEKKLQLPEPVDVNPADLPAESAPSRLPSCLEDSLAAFEADTVMRAALGEAMVQAIVAVRKTQSLPRFSALTTLLNDILQRNLANLANSTLNRDNVTTSSPGNAGDTSIPAGGNDRRGKRSSEEISPEGPSAVEVLLGGTPRAASEDTRAAAVQPRVSAEERVPGRQARALQKMTTAADAAAVLTAADAGQPGPTTQKRQRAAPSADVVQVNAPPPLDCAAAAGAFLAIAAAGARDNSDNDDGEAPDNLARHRILAELYGVHANLTSFMETDQRVRKRVLPSSTPTAQFPSIPPTPTFLRYRPFQQPPEWQQ